MVAVSRLRPWLGVVFRELPRYTLALSGKDDRYLALCNRGERLQPAPSGPGFRCDWQWTSDLHAPKQIPSLGRRLMARALADHPIRCEAAPLSASEQPTVSFVIGHRGESRLSHLLATLGSIAGQQQAAIECVVVEQDVEPRVASRLPAWVRHIHLPPPTAEMPYCRSWAFNVGVRQARGDVLILHDNDMLIPIDYAATILEKISHGYEVVNPKRFIFYLNGRHTERMFTGQLDMYSHPPETIVQNLEGGGSVAITRKCFDRIGGMDESFVGWGGEDNEFWDRAKTQKCWPFGYLALVHLWHAAQPGKHQTSNTTIMHYQALSAIPALARIARLRSLVAGQLSGPVGWRS